jgi:hypothetical protein
MTNNNSSSAPRLYPGVMISSTFEDLKDYRAAMIEALDGYDLFPIKMENQLPRHGTNVLLSSLQKVSDSSGFVAIIGHRYGTIPDSPSNPGRLSLTELEYNEALLRGLPLLVLMKAEGATSPGDEDESAESKIKLKAFRKRVHDEQLCTIFNDLTNFTKKARDVAAELRRLIDERSASAAPVLSVSQSPQHPTVHPDHEPAPPPKHHLITPQTHQKYVEFRFTEVLRPILLDLKVLLGVPELALAFLPQRYGSAAPTLDHEDYNDYEKIRSSLLAQSMNLRTRELSSAVVIDEDGELSVYDHREITPRKYINAIANGLPAANWHEWVDSDYAEQVSSWIANPDKEVVCSFKYIPSRDNHDVAGFVVVPRPSRTAKQKLVAQDVGEQVERLLNEQLLPILRHLVLDFAKQQVYEHGAREIVLNTILEAAVSLSGADWGCIKSSTLGAASSDLHAEKCEQVQAVCVNYCPRFFQEGRLIDTEELVAFAVKQDKDMVLELSESTRNSFRHPAMQMAVFLIRDPEQVIEPRLPDSDVVGAIVVQHTATNYLKEFMHVYSPFLQELAEVTARVTRAAASKSLVSILKKGVTGRLTPDFEHKVDDIVKRLAPGAQVTWVLLQPNGSFFKTVCESPNDLAGLKQVLKELIGADKPIHNPSRLAAFVCNSTISLLLPQVHYLKRDIIVERVGINEFGARAYFHEGYELAVADLQREHRNQVIFNLGDHELWKDADAQKGSTERLGAVVIMPIVSPVGSPVGVLAVLREVSNLGPKWDPKLKGFQTELADLRDELYASHLALSKGGAGG